jgi:hypothetical protein
MAQCAESEWLDELEEEIPAQLDTVDMLPDGGMVRYQYVPWSVTIERIEPHPLVQLTHVLVSYQVRIIRLSLGTFSTVELTGLLELTADRDGELDFTEVSFLRGLDARGPHRGTYAESWLT